MKIQELIDVLVRVNENDRFMISTDGSFSFKGEISRVPEVYRKKKIKKMCVQRWGEEGLLYDIDI